MKLIFLEQPSGNPAIQDQGSFWWCLFLRLSQLVLAQVGISTAVSCGHFLYQPAVAEQDFIFLTQGISKGGWIYLHWARCPSLGAHREVWDPVQCSQPGPLTASALVLGPPDHLPSLLPKQQAKSSSKETRRLWNRVCIPHQVPRAQKLSAVSYSHLFLVRHPLMRTGSDKRGGIRKLHKQNKSVIKLILQMSRSGLGCNFSF